MIDDQEVVVVLKLNAKGEAVRVEDRDGKALECVNIEEQPIQGKVEALEPIVLITAQYNPTCTWVRIGRTYYRVCW